jgi:hypothetical protein
MVQKGIPQDLIHGDAQLRNSPSDGVIRSDSYEPPRTIDFLPYVFPPNNFVPFDIVNSQNILAGATVVIPIFGPINSNAVVRWFGNEAATAVEYAFLQWTILVGGTPYQPYQGMLYSRGAIDNPDPIIIRVAPNRIVTVSVTNTDGGAAHVATTRLKGWLY